MSAKEVLDVVVYSEEIDIALQKIQTARMNMRLISKVKTDAEKVAKVVESAGVRNFIKNIPTLTRAQRMIATQIPLMQEALQISFRGKMIAAADPYTAVAVLSIYVVRMIKDMQEQIKQERIDYENMLQEGLDLNYKELNGLLNIQTGFATWYDQFLAAIETEGFLSAVKSIIEAALPGILQDASTQKLAAEGFIATGQIDKWWEIPSASDVEAMIIRGEAID